MSRRPLSVAMVLALAFTSQAAPIDEMAGLHAASIAKHAVGSWVTIRDAGGRELTSTLLEKRETPDGWMIRNKLEPGGEHSSLVGSATELARGGTKVVAVASETVEVAGKKLACRVFTLGDGQRQWVSPDVPLGGLVKIAGADGTPFLTLLDWGTT